ncbi:glycosyltransferase family 2 protein [Lentibacter algarum]|uniref:glycosyltransferase family 2 protein n=1 Tax=Lentibacter algarum TaxID=576131 RepID=UPI001C0657F7|nr:glycosyltransferase family 2 protein [Lentibacter algarum]MBU2982094.1 glycosyltransferase family 2 protein [Lentibacter algarum]
MTQDYPKWGIVTTLKAPLEDIANFAAHHIELGAHRLFIYLDADHPEAFSLLKSHPKIRTFKADEANWRSAKRPEKHQTRQTANAQHAYRRKASDVAWLAHIDVDEFLWPEAPIEEQLAALPDACAAARVRPIEALSAEGQGLQHGVTCFKAMTSERKQRRIETEAIYPTFGAQLTGGFLSHVAGKVFARTGLEETTFKIHNFYADGEENPGQQELLETKLCHLHAHTYESWKAAYRFRLSKGAYRAELRPNRPREQGGLSLHELLSFIEQSDGEEGLRTFYHEVCTATPELLERLDAYGLLHCLKLDLAEKRMRQFPNFPQ